MQKVSKSRGITLISLVITIIILIILAGVTIGLINGNDGILSKTKLAKWKYQNSANDENGKINTYENEIDKTAIDVASTRDEVTISKDEYNRLVNANSYSLDEKEIGKWIDGSKIYRKVFDYGKEITIYSGWTSLNLGLSKYNIKNLIKVYNNTDYGCVAYFAEYNFTKDNIGVYVETGNYYLSRYFILEYTKTTD